VHVGDCGIVVALGQFDRRDIGAIVEGIARLGRAEAGGEDERRDLGQLRARRQREAGRQRADGDLAGGRSPVSR
jgi:hypothetical protein